jgi:parallel beta-helix repeat protein
MGTTFKFYIIIVFFFVPVYVWPCAGADPGDTRADDVALQRCLDGGGTITLKYGRPGYIINHSLRITVDGTRLTANKVSPARVIASDTLIGPLILAEKVNHFVVQYLHIDGRKGTRLNNSCEKTSGNSVAFVDCKHFIFADNRIVNTLCGTSLLVTGEDFTIARNSIKNGGYEPDKLRGKSFADGITAGRCERSLIANNVLKNNTDVGIIVGGGAACRVVDNKIKQSTTFASAGLWIFNFTCGHCGDGKHPGSLFARNKIVSTTPNGMGAGIIVGGHIVSKDLWVDDAGTITENQVAGAGVNLLVDGVKAGTIAANKLQNPSGKAGGYYFGNGCTNQEHYNYTVAHSGMTSLQRGWTPKIFDSYSCTILPAGDVTSDTEFN